MKKPETTTILSENEDSQNDNTTEDQADINESSTFTRRQFLIGVGRALTGLAAASVLRSSGVGTENSQKRFADETVQGTELELVPNSYIQFSDTERILNLPERSHYPDGHVPFATVNGIKYVWLSSGPNTYRYQMNENGQVDKNPYPKIPVLSPSNETYKNGYAGITTIVQPDLQDSKNMFALAHYEEHESLQNWSNFTASVGLLKSSDGGKSFELVAVINKGTKPLPPGKTRVLGAGQPQGLLVGEKDFYVFYVDWAEGRPDQVYLSKIDLTSKNPVPKYWNGFEFVDDMNQESAVFSPPNNGQENIYAALPSVSYNKELGEFLATFETDIGVYITSSADLVNWQLPELLVKYPAPLSSVWKGESGYS